MMICHDCWPSSKYKGECYFHPKRFPQLPWIVSALEMRTWGDWTWALQACLVTHHVYFWLESSCDFAAKIAAIVGKEQDVRAIVQCHPSFVEASDYEGKINTQNTAWSSSGTTLQSCSICTVFNFFWETTFLFLISFVQNCSLLWWRTMYAFAESNGM